ncbi:GPR endopeptidase [Clostridium senegalense]|uniref:GPR endopeptidase n=1 Tax=Clostridium senegalense TaxID=1465809 RepID=UPI0002893432|nr:GPR endopeptidase [Clostridium senegalense]MBU5225480.1 GPR endopeptidase [Clostridium senegalense]
MNNIRTDLALEAREYYTEQNSEEREIDGVEVEEYIDKQVMVSHVKVINENGEKIIGKPKGSYVTLEFADFVYYDVEAKEDLSQSLAKELSKLVKINDKTTALVVGLGNWNITPDALGPKVTSKLMVTRHLKEYVPDSIDEGIIPVSAIAPGVLGITGVETSEIVKGVVDRVKPNVVICIDALASRKTQRVNRTIQIGNTGISPGAGIGNNRMALNEKELGVPVIAIGVPTVVDAATLANDTIELVIEDLMKEAKSGSEFYNSLNSLDRDEKEVLIGQVLGEKMATMVVTPKDIDMVVDCLSKIIANGINIALQPALTLEDIDRYLN